jgi:hypothetical protein
MKMSHSTGVAVLGAEMDGRLIPVVQMHNRANSGEKIDRRTHRENA